MALTRGKRGRTLVGRVGRAGDGAGLRFQASRVRGSVERRDRPLRGREEGGERVRGTDPVEEVALVGCSRDVRREVLLELCVLLGDATSGGRHDDEVRDELRRVGEGARFGEGATV